jgi:uncharacterized OB-fold protein
MDLTPLFDADARADAARLNGSRCESCGTWAFPARQICASCLAREQRPAVLSGRGLVRCSTRLENPPAGFDAPITVGVVELAEGPAVFALLAEGSPAGHTVQARPAPVKGGADGFSFWSAS